jgi:predicted Rossmann fold nucleotide-binding protein DprA/Smf involved in DNA uptake
LGAEPRHIDEIVRATGLAPGRLSAVLLTLELKGLTCQLSGKRFAVQMG